MHGIPICAYDINRAKLSEYYGCSAGTLLQRFAFDISTAKTLSGLRRLFKTLSVGAEHRKL